jgi:hypothetical protein
MDTVCLFILIWCDCAVLLPERSKGNDDVKPYIAGTFRRSALSMNMVRFEWRVGNCVVGEDAAFSSAILDGQHVGDCLYPLCFIEAEGTLLLLELHGPGIPESMYRYNDCCCSFVCMCCLCCCLFVHELRHSRVVVV